MAKTITARLSDDCVTDLKKIEKIEQLDTSSVIRKFLANSIADWKKRYAVEQYKNGEFSFGQAAKFAEVSVWDFPSLLKENNVPLNLNKEEFEEELKTIEWILQKKKKQ